MKKIKIHIIILLLSFAILIPNGSAQDYMTWGLPEGAVARLGKGRISGNIAFSPDGNKLAVASSIGIWIYDVRPGKEKELELLTGHAGRVTYLAYSPDGKTLASGGQDRTVRLWDVIAGEQKTKLTGHEWTISSLAFSPDGKTIASATGLHADMIDIEIEIKLWNIDTGEPVGTFMGHEKDVTSLAFSPDGKTIASSGKDRKVILWNVSTGKSDTLPTEHKKDVVFVGYSPDGKTIATGSWDDTVKIWDAKTGDLKSTITEQGFGGVTSVAFLPKGSTIAVGGNMIIRLWDIQTKKHIRTFRGHNRSVSSMAFSPDGNTLATVGDQIDNTIMLWDLQAAKQRTTIKGHNSMLTCLTYEQIVYTNLNQ